MLLAAKRGAGSSPSNPSKTSTSDAPPNHLLILQPNIKNIRELMTSWFGYRLPPYLGYVVESFLIAT
jgi:hypothetical protein